MDGYRGHSALDSGYDSKVKLHHVEELNQQMNKLRVHMSDLELQLQSSLASTYTGAFLWRIPDVTRRRRDALEGRVTSIYSPPFYTGRFVYDKAATWMFKKGTLWGVSVSSNSCCYYVIYNMGAYTMMNIEPATRVWNIKYLFACNKPFPFLQFSPPGVPMHTSLSF